jgi:hypothetical protein
MPKRLVGEQAPLRLVRWRGTPSITGAVSSTGVAGFPGLIRERVAGLCYRSIRGSPKSGKTLLSANQVIVEIWSPSSVRTSSPYGRAISVCGDGK